MALTTTYNLNPTSPAQITREEYTDVGSSPFQLGTAARNFLTGTDFEIWTDASGGTQLTENTDYELTVTNTKLLSKYGVTCKTRVTITNATYQTGSIFITYKVVSSETDAAYFNYLNTTDSSLQSQISALGSPLTVVKTASYTILDDDTITRIEVDTTSADVTITLPLIANNEGRQIELAHVKGANKVIIVSNATDSTKLTSDDLAILWLPIIGDYIVLKHSSSSGFWEALNERITCQYEFDTYAGFGSVDNKILRYTNNPVAKGNLISENHNTGYAGNVDGLEITINRSGRYAFTMTALTGSVGTNHGISVNSNQLTTSIVNITQLHRKAFSSVGSSMAAVNIAFTDFFVKGDIVRPHSDGVASTATAKFNLVYLGN